MTALGRLVPPDFEHVEKYSLRELPHDMRPELAPVAIGVNWYVDFDTPQRGSDGVWRIGQMTASLGGVRGGHCVCLEPARQPEVKGGEQDNAVWWPYYDQGNEGSCVGHGCSRMMSLINRKRYDAVWLYNEARQVDGFPMPHEGTTVRAACSILKNSGHRVAHGKVSTSLSSSDPLSPAEGIAVYRWATRADEVLAALGTPHLDYVTLLNSWGKTYEHRVQMPASTLQRLLDEQGEALIVTDR